MSDVNKRPLSRSVFTEHSLESEILEEGRTYWLYLPPSYGENFDESYPVLYLLDAENHFAPLTGILDFMSAKHGGDRIPEAIVIGVPNTDRTRDLTPTHTLIGEEGREETYLKHSGGGQAFLQFVRRELFEDVEARYRASDHRVLIGHSFGGILTLYAFLNEPHMFRSYIAADPSFWWDNQVLTRQLDVISKPLSGSAYISLANISGNGLSNAKAVGRMGRVFTKKLESIKPPALSYKWQYFEHENHLSVPLLSWYHGLLHTFESI